MSLLDLSKSLIIYCTEIFTRILQIKDVLIDNIFPKFIYKIINVVKKQNYSRDFLLFLKDLTCAETTPYKIKMVRYIQYLPSS